MKMITNTMLLAGCLALGNICAVQAASNPPEKGKPMDECTPNLQRRKGITKKEALRDQLKKANIAAQAASDGSAPGKLVRDASRLSVGIEPGDEIIDHTKSFESIEVLKKFIEETIKTAFKEDKKILAHLRTLKRGGSDVPSQKKFLKKKINDQLDTLVTEAIDSAGWKGKGTQGILKKAYKSFKVDDKVTVLKTNSETDWSVIIQGQADGVPVAMHVTAEDWCEHFKSLGFGQFDLNRLRKEWRQRFEDGNWIKELIKEQIETSQPKRVMPIGYWEPGTKVTLKNQKITVFTRKSVMDAHMDRKIGFRIVPGDRFIVLEDIGDGVDNRVRLAHAITKAECNMGKFLFRKKYELISL